MFPVPKLRIQGWVVKGHDWARGSAEHGSWEPARVLGMGMPEYGSGSTFADPCTHCHTRGDKVPSRIFTGAQMVQLLVFGWSQVA